MQGCSFNRRISIHAPRTGSDGCSAGIRRNPGNFNPRSPHGERPERRRPRPTRTLFQSTLPARGATRRPDSRTPGKADFNPRSPHGERRGRDNSRRGRHAFQSTLPARGATTAQHPDSPARGHFNPRSPHGERLSCARATKVKISISIHAPRTGSDTPDDDRCTVAAEFQSTLPARGATAQSNNSVDQNHRLCTKSIPQNSPFEN